MILLTILIFILPRNKKKTHKKKSLSLEAVTQKVTVIEGRMSVLESSFEILIQKTAELMEELRLTHEQLAIKTEDLILLRMERSRTTTECKDVDVDVLKEELECLSLRMDIGER